MANDPLNALARARSLLQRGDLSAEVSITIADLSDSLRAARATQIDFIKFPKDHIFSPQEAVARRRWALDDLIPKFCGAARGLGYAVFHGGTYVRDIDLVAMPWRTPGELAPDDFVLEMCHCIPLHMGDRGNALFGHRWYALWEANHRDHQIDLKVILPAADPKESSR